ncbi:DUF4157 domain-containing protein [uncultured Thiodictyon sp.]|jgi:hypothetical protein|uniref:eCIS core domain-containing protein n=1 Tax=uncultured Thiodictyon sp. TaxID=1846217 RepID=UPI0025EC6A9D|nr:DUF4157 domain-containing protein [uncultured Thiodictyon sp.]
MISLASKEGTKAKTQTAASTKPAPASPAQAATNPVWTRLALAGVRPKLAVGAPDDPLEHEADALAERVLRIPYLSAAARQAAMPSLRALTLQRKCVACEEEEKDEKLLRKVGAGEPDSPGTVPAIVDRALSTPGQPLEPKVRGFFEPRFGQDFSAVRVHTDALAASSAAAIGANAFAYGNHIAFAAGRYDPRSGTGQRLIAHEIAHVLQQPGYVARDPDPQAPDQKKCTTGVTPGAARADPDNRDLGPSGTYYIQGPVYKGESVELYCDLAIQAWIPWRFGVGKLSAAVASRIRTEASLRGWHWTNGVVPKEGCQAQARISMDSMNRLVALAGRDQAASQAGAKESEAGLPPLPPPEAIYDEEIVVTASRDPDGPSTQETKKLDPRVEAEKALDPTSVYEAGAPGANRPPFPARMEGPEMEVPNGIGAYKMILEYAWATSDPLLQLAYHMNAVSYTWEIFNVTQMIRAGMGKGVQEEARRMHESPQAQAAAGGANRQHMLNDVDQLSQESTRSLQELRNPRQAAEGRSAIDVITRTIANKLNLELLPASELIAAGGWLVRGFASLLDTYSQEKEIGFPKDQGYYLVRCIAQPSPRGPNNSERRAASVRAQIVEVRSPESLAKNALYMPDAAIAELQASKALTSDPAEIARLDAQIARIAEQSGSIRRDAKGNIVEEKPAGDLAVYLSGLVDEKQKEYDRAPSWQKDRLDRELQSLKQRLEQATKNRDGTIGVHHRPRVAFTSVITGETYPLLIELSEVEAKSGSRVRLMDLTVPDRPPIDRSGTDLDQAMTYALRGLGESGLGRGTLVVRLPTTWPGGARELPPIRTLDGPEAVVKRRLADLATALLVLSLVVPGVGEVSMVIAAGLAVERLVSRAINGTLRIDAESISDTLAILGAVAQGAQLIGRLRIVKAGNSFIAAAKTGEQGAIETAAKALEAARKAGRILDATSLVANVGGLIWGDLVTIDEFVQLERDEIDGKITHSEARRRRADMLSSAITNHGIMLGGILRPHGAEKASGVEKPPPEKVAPAPGSKRAGPETLPESTLEKRAGEVPAPTGPGKTAPEPKPDGVRARFKTPDNLHNIFILNDGTIYRCSLSCGQLRTWYDSYLKAQPEGTRRQHATQLDSLLQALEARAAAGENTPALNEAIGKLDVAMREFIVPDVAAELQRGSESRKLVKPGEKFLGEDQVRHLLKFFNLDEIQALTGANGLTSAESIRRFASRSEAFLGQVKDLTGRLGRPVDQIAKAFEGLAKAGTSEADVMGVLNGFTAKADIAALGTLIDTMAASGSRGAEAADFVGRVARIRQVKGVTIDLPELHAAFERGDAILDHGDLQTGKFLNDMVGGERAVLGEGRLDVGTGGGNMPASLPRALDFVIIETEGTFRLVLGQEHTGLSGGRASVFAAGTLRFNKQGVITEISNNSGHYRPSSANLDRAVQFMYDRGILSRQVDPATGQAARPVTVTYIR